MILARQNACPVDYGVDQVFCWEESALSTLRQMSKVKAKRTITDPTYCHLSRLYKASAWPEASPPCLFAQVFV